MKSKIQTLVGVVMLCAFLFGIGRTIYTRNFDDFIEVIKTPDKPVAPITNALFWVEKELEKNSRSASAKLAHEAGEVFNPLFGSLKECGLVNDKIKTLTPYAVEELIRLDAYRGTEPDVWEVAAGNNQQYIFKANITSYTASSTNLNDVFFLFSFYEVENRSLIWQVKAKRMSGFFSGRTPEIEKIVNTIIISLNASGVLNSEC